MTSEIVTFNLYKMHGSLNWDVDCGDVVCCDHIKKIKDIKAIFDKDDDFLLHYGRLAIVNPTKAKLNQTVLDVNYYDQLRMFCNEMEKSNTILVAFGFSFNDEHIRHMTYRFLKGNPTLNLIIMSFNADATENFKKHFDTYSNVTVIQLVSEVNNDDTSSIETINFTLEQVNKVLEEIYNGTK